MMDTSVDGRPLRWDLNELHLSNRATKGLKTRYIPLSQELRAMLELRRYDPAGHEFGPNAYVFGNEVGERLKNYQSAGPTSTRCNCSSTTPTSRRAAGISSRQSWRSTRRFDGSTSNGGRAARHRSGRKSWPRCARTRGRGHKEGTNC
jgi:hypothetical protein